MSRNSKLRAKRGEIAVFAEIAPQYRGLGPMIRRSSPSTRWPSGSTYRSASTWAMGRLADPIGSTRSIRAALGNPLLLEDLLVRHPKMRVYVMHAGMPMVDEMIMVMNAHPQVFVDISADNWGVPAQGISCHPQAARRRRLWQADHVRQRPDDLAGTIPVAFASITEANFLTAEQKRDILYNNAARFLRLTASRSPATTTSEKIAVAQWSAFVLLRVRQRRNDRRNEYAS